MALYRKKTVVVEALQLRWDTWNEMCEFVGVGKPEDGKPKQVIGMTIPTPEGLMIVKENDWIIKGINGDLFVRTPDAFEQAYEPVEDGK